MGGKGKKQTTIEVYAEKQDGDRTAGKGSGAAGNGAGETAPPEDTGTMGKDAQLILMELRDFRKEVDQQFGSLSTRMDLMQTHAEHITERVKEAESCIEVLETIVTLLEKQVQQVRDELRKLHDRQEDLEGRNRRSNLRLLGMPESRPMQKMELFLEELLPKLLPEFKPTAHFVIERAHRSLAVRPVTGASPRAIIFKLLNYRDRDALLRAVSEHGEIRWEGARLSLYPDLTLVVQKARKCFDEVKLELRKRGLVYAMLHPAKLRIQHGDKAMFFNDVKQAWTFLNSTARKASAPKKNGNNGAIVTATQDDIEEI